MPWKCPACQTEIRHDGDGLEPRRVYRCHVCHLELVHDQSTNKLAVAAWPNLPERRATVRKP